MMGTNLLPVYKGDKLNLTFFQGSGMFNFTVTVEDIIKERGLTYLEVEIRSEISRLQRRDFVRLDTILPIAITPLPDVEHGKGLSDTEAVGIITDRRLAGDISEDEVVGGFTLDISAGGVRFFCKKPMEINSVADCDVFLEDGDKITASIRMILCERDLHEGNVVMRARFIGIAESLRDKIIKHIFAEQLKRRRAEKRLQD
jgi:c-di-GMP-binding flagellar brake protein YcgR